MHMNLKEGGIGEEAVGEIGMEERVRGLWREVRELSLGSSGMVERLESAPSPLRFLREYASANKPCIVSRSATEHWPAISKSLWEDDRYLCSKAALSQVSVHLTPDGRADALVPLPHPQGEEGGSLCFASACVRSMSLSEALRLIVDTGKEDEAAGNVVAYAQQQNDCFRSEYGALAGDVDSHIPWATEAFGGCLPEAVNLWIGNARSHTSFHRDHYENLYAVITGEKHFLLLPPTDVHRLYIRRYPAAQYYYNYNSSSSSSSEGEVLELRLDEPRREVPWCSVDPCPPSQEELQRQMVSFPLYFDGPQPFRCTVRAGEILYLPSMWFHHVTQTPHHRTGRTIAINYWYDMQFDIKYAYFNFLQSIRCLSPTAATTTHRATGSSSRLVSVHDNDNDNDDADDMQHAHLHTLHMSDSDSDSGDDALLKTDT
ncbi:phospholipase A2, group IVB [Iris pallida]|uniref:Phospholipase A2, group IVB n=1 Tax=Iris pallida TaxID=29817 RepID=A0AAX6G1B7_IRIPA|nr:phospholipase A2, group IVB [Iris pallida]